MNDRTEFQGAIRLAQEWASRARGTERDETAKRFLDIFSSILAATDRLLVCVASFSAAPDQLSQWRGYSGGGGLSLGFSSQLLQATATSCHALFVSCIYDEDKHRLVMNGTLDCNYARARLRLLRGASEDYIREMALGLAEEVDLVAPALKHPAFEAEKEWRLIWEPYVDGPVDETAGVSFKSRRGMLVPFRALPLTPDGTPLEIPDIVVGPSSEPDLSLRAVAAFLRRNAVVASSVRLSSVPFRQW